MDWLANNWGWIVFLVTMSSLAIFIWRKKDSISTHLSNSSGVEASGVRALPYHLITPTILAFGLLGTSLLMAKNLWGIIFLAISLAMVFGGLRKISADPPHKAVVTVYGKKTGYIRGEGWVLVAPYFPFVVDLIPESVEKRNRDFFYKEVRCRSTDIPGMTVAKAITMLEEKTPEEIEKSIGGDTESGGSVEVDASITWEADPERLINFINTGEDENVEQILDDMFGEDIRQLGRLLTWTQMTFAGDEISVHLLRRLVGRDCFRQHGDDPRAVKSAALANGISDVWDLGIKIRRLNVKRVKPEGRLEEEASRTAIEQQQRQAEVHEVGTLEIIMESLKHKFPNLSDQEILNAAQAERHKIQRLVIDGSAGELAKAGALAGGLLNKRGGG